MKYKVLLTALRAMVYVKRSAWWIGKKTGKAGGFVFNGITSGVLWLKYQINYRVKKTASGRLKERLLKRGALQIGLFLCAFIITAPQTEVMVKEDPIFVGRRAVAGVFLNPSEIYDQQEIIVEAKSVKLAPAPDWRQGAVAPTIGGGLPSISDQDYSTLVAGGTAILQPIFFPSVNTISKTARKSIINYQVQVGDSLTVIAQRFNVSLATILWENNLSERALIRPGNILRIPPVSGVFYKVRKGDTVQKIAKTYGVKAEVIIEFNNLGAGGGKLVADENIMVPGGIKPRAATAISAARVNAVAGRYAAPAPSLNAPSAQGFIWPAAARYITQYFSWRHSGVDVAGQWQTPIYAAKAGIVEKAQCGWNSGYGCVVIIDHGGGVKTLYGHSSVLLVSLNEYIEAGQTIALMGNTGNVRGVTGIHLHFEVRINGRAVNPFRYVK